MPWLARLAVVHALQLPALGLLIYGQGGAVPWLAGVWGSLVCCAGTDSGWRWLNRLLITEAIGWLVIALVLGV
jgi:hypothetical protein